MDRSRPDCIFQRFSPINRSGRDVRDPAKFDFYPPCCGGLIYFSLSGRFNQNF
ncbi:MAG: hypothetical protein LBT09_12755 [Planctomycetaceae bacterium]|nr:hypothetical protein [Planctomycetaceae bacterium]